MDAPSSPQKPPAETRIAVIGAGIVGINCALALAKEGFRVTVIDRDDPGEGCSFGNAGILAEWSFVPIFGPEVLRSVPGYLMDREGPLTIRWTRLPHILPWLLRLLPHANAAHLKRAADALHHLTIGCTDAYVKLASEAGAPELVRQDPVLQVYERETDFRKAEKDLAFRSEYGIKYDVLDRQALQDLEPALGESFKWGHALKGGGTTVNPGRLVKVLAEALRQRGGTILKRDVQGLTRHAGNGQGTGFTIETASGNIPADRLVIAAGAFSHRLARMLGEHFPLGTERGYHALIANPGIEVRHTIAWKARAFCASPMEMGLRLAGTVELAGLNAPPDYRRAEIIARHARTLLPSIGGDVTSQWMGFRPTLPDSMPVIGPSATADDLFYAFGHQHVGLTCGPATGRIVARLMKGDAPNVDIEPFSANRF